MSSFLKIKNITQNQLMIRKSLSRLTFHLTYVHNEAGHQSFSCRIVNLAITIRKKTKEITYPQPHANAKLCSPL